jgi:hypothetical protein
MLLGSWSFDIPHPYLSNSIIIFGSCVLCAVIGENLRFNQDFLKRLRDLITNPRHTYGAASAGVTNELFLSKLASWEDLVNINEDLIISQRQYCPLSDLWLRVP